MDRKETEDNEIWQWNEEVQERIQMKRLAKKQWDSQEDEESNRR